MLGVELRIASADGRVLYDAYSDLVRDLQQLVSDVDRFVEAPGDRLTWGVTHQDHPGHLTVKAEPLDGAADPLSSQRLQQVASAVVSGAARLGKESGIPDFFTDESVTLLGRAARRRQAPGIQGLELVAMNGVVQTVAVLDANVERNAGRSVEAGSSSMGSIEGVLDTLSMRPMPRAAVFDARTRRAVRVQADDALLLRLHPLFGQKVLVGGVIMRNARGQAVRIRADTVEVLPQDVPQARLADLIGIAPGWTGRRPVADVIDELRGD